MAGLSKTAIAAAAFALVAGCGRGQPEPQPTPVPAPTPRPVANPIAPAPSPPPYVPPAPGEPGGLPDDRTPISEAPFTPQSPNGAGNVVQTYYALIEAGKFADAYALWSDSGRASGTDAAAFADRYRGYREFHANIGRPGRIEGAAGSLYIEIPVQEYGRAASGEPFNRLGQVTLRRVNDVPGSTDEQRQWRIAKIETKAAP